MRTTINTSMSMQARMLQAFCMLAVMLCLLVLALPVHAAVPGAPTITSGHPERNGSGTILFSPPASDGGSPITSYTLTSNPGNLTASGPASPLTVTGLTIGTSYSFTVTATNANGTSVASAAPISFKARPYAPLTGTMNNLVVFIRFSDQPEFTQTRTYYDNALNSSSTSLKNYYLENSYNAMTVNSTLLPISAGPTVVSYQDANPTAYYLAYNAATNPIGYQPGGSTARETALITNALAAISAQIPGGLNLDIDGDGFVDHITFEVYSTNTNPLPGMFFSRATYDTSGTVMLNGLKVGAYTWVTAAQDFPSTPGSTEIHEMGHSFGYPDLRGNSRVPVGNYDVMSLSTAVVHNSAWEKNRFTKWIATIPELSSSAYGTYSLNDLTQSTNNSYKIKLSGTDTEYLILEYRKAAGAFETHLPGSGLCVTRVNEAAGMWGNLGVPPFFLYYFRTDGTPGNDGSAGNNFTCLSAETGRTQLNDNSNPYCFRSDGSACGISIYNVGSNAGSSISFSLGDPAAATVNRVISGYLANGGNRVAGATMTLSGDASAVTTTDSLGRYLFVVNNGGNYTVTPTKVNLNFSPVSKSYTPIASDQIQNYAAANNTNTISGTVYAGGVPVSGAVVTCTPGAGGNSPAPITTDATGTYSFTVYAGADYVIRPTKTNYFFSPTTRSLTSVTTDQTGKDFDIATGTVNLTGTITLNGSALGGIDVSAPGANTTTPITTTGSGGAAGTYSFTVTIGNGSTYTVTPSSPLYKFSPVNKFYTGLISNQATNFVATALTASSTALGSSANPATPGQSVTLTATVTGSAPTGTVDFNDGATPVCTAVALNAGQAQCTTSSLSLGSHSIVAAYSGDANNLASNSSTLTQLIALLSQSISFTSTAPNAAVVGGSTYTVTASGGASGNAIVFSIAAASSAICSISGSTVSFTGIGACTINANQAGNATYSAAPQVQQSFSVATNVVSSSTALGSSANPANAGQSVTFTATVTGSAPTGSVTFNDGVTPICSAVALSNGQAQCVTSSLAAGSHSVVAAYSGNGSNASSNSSTLNQVIALNAQAIAFTSSAPGAATNGGATYVVTASGGASGNAVVFSIAAASSAICSISGSTVSFTGVGTCTINANQAGNATYSAAPQVQQSFSVAANVVNSSTALGTSANPANAGQSVTFTATVTGSAPTGTVTFNDGATPICSGVALSNAQAQCATSLLAVGSHNIVAAYSGNGNNASSNSSTLNQVISINAQTIAFTSTAPGAAAVGGAAYTVTASGGASGNAIVFSIAVASSAVCSISGSTVSFIGTGTCTINANQAGNASYSAATQAQQSFAVSAAPTVTTSAAASVSVSGATLNGNVNANGAVATVSFEYGTTISYGMTAAANPTTVAPGAGNAVSSAISGLSCNTTYHFRVKAVNAAGTGNGSDLIFTTSACPGVLPGAPTINAVTPGPGKASIAFSVPASNGGTPITSYLATCTASGQASRSANAAASPVTVVGMLGNMVYSCTVAAINGVGTGPSSQALQVQPAKNVNVISVILMLLQD
ncbi:hypothetical protein BH11PSE11_BH11PSE11_22420 [soil metagenome]